MGGLSPVLGGLAPEMGGLALTWRVGSSIGRVGSSMEGGAHREGRPQYRKQWGALVQQVRARVHQAVGGPGTARGAPEHHKQRTRVQRSAQQSSAEQSSAEQRSAEHSTALTRPPLGRRLRQHCPGHQLRDAQPAGHDPGHLLRAYRLLHAGHRLRQVPPGALLADSLGHHMLTGCPPRAACKSFWASCADRVPPARRLPILWGITC